jgi:hypothetical protein
VVQQYGLAHARVIAHRGGGRLVEPLGVHTLTGGAGKNAGSWPDRGCGRTVLPVVSRQVPWRKGCWPGPAC